MMNDQTRNSSKRLWQWIWASIGTLIIGLAGAWLNDKVGPDSQHGILNPCATYKPSKALEEMLNQAKTDSGAPDFIHAFVHDAALLGDYELWVADCGKVQGEYMRDFNNFRTRVVPYEVYTNDDGKTCRELNVGIKKAGRWQYSSDIFCKDGGKWKSVSSTRD